MVNWDKHRKLLRKISKDADLEIRQLADENLELTNELEKAELEGLKEENKKLRNRIAQIPSGIRVITSIKKQRGGW